MSAHLHARDVSRSKEYPWYATSVGDQLTPEVREVLHDYAGVGAVVGPSRKEGGKENEDEDEDEMVKHVYAVRDAAWEIYPWPCIGLFFFLQFSLSTHPDYETILRTLKHDPAARLLDLGTCLGQDIRKLIHDGASPTQLYGSDVFPEFEGAGHLLFRDAEKLAGHFIVADVFDESVNSALIRTRGSWDVVALFLVLHVWDLDTQVRACKAVLLLLKAREGACIVGLQTGALQPKHIPLWPPFKTDGKEEFVYRHSVDTFRLMWEGVGKELGVPLDIAVEYRRAPGQPLKTGSNVVFGGDGNLSFFFKFKFWCLVSPEADGSARRFLMHLPRSARHEYKLAYVVTLSAATVWLDEGLWYWH
ncbi:MAG: hypothetical protein M1838_000133 [Thelocarpon superellum]|nr:MAG: hypothetical protein M1838_000133 [Thelocarpon superellum]